MTQTELAEVFKALAYPTRLALLSTLRFPRAVREIRLQPLQHDPSLPDARPMSVQAVRKHLARLESLELVRRLGTEGDGGRMYVVDRPRLYALSEEFAQLTSLYAGHDGGPDVTSAIDTAVARSAPVQPGRPDRPSLVLVHGAYEGHTFVLDQQHQVDGRWTIGREEGASIRLDYDPYVSRLHAWVLSDGGSLRLVDNPDSQNGTRLNWQEVPMGQGVELRSGDVIGVGRSLLVAAGI